jgi:thymidylate kinase
MTEAVESILIDLENAGVRYCVLHGGRDAGGDPDSDLDIAVHPQDMARFESTLDRGRRCIQLLQHESSAYYFVLAPAKDGFDGLIRLDAATDFRRNGRVFLSAEQLLEGRRRTGPIWISSAATELQYLLVKRALKGRLADRSRERIAALVHELGPEAVRTAGRILGARVASRILSRIVDATWEALPDQVASLRRTLLTRWSLLHPDAGLRYLVPELRRILRRFRSPTGICVAAIGPDGAGKSVLVRDLGDAARGAFRRSDVFHLRARLLAARRAPARERDPHGKRPYGAVLSIVKILYLWSACWLGHHLVVRRRLVRSSLALFDRCFHDILVDPRRYRYGGPMWLARALAKVLPRPQLFFVLDAPPDRLRGRKDELDVDELRRQRSAYREFAADWPGSVLLDGTLPEEEVTRLAVEALLEFLRERYAARRRSLLPGSRSCAVREGLEALGPGAIVEPPEQRRGRSAFGALVLRDGRSFLLPMRPMRAAAGALRIYSAQSFRARAARAGVATALRFGLGGIALARVPGDGEHSPLADHLRSLLGIRDIRFGVSLGTPGPHRKPVVQVIDSGGRTLAWVKVGWNEATRELVRHEAETVKSVQERGPRSFNLPQVLHVGPWRDRLLLVESISTGPLRAAPRRFQSPYPALLAELRELNRDNRPLRQSRFVAGIASRSELLPDGHARRLVQRGLNHLERIVGRDVLPFHFCHGDFAPWNMLSAGGRIVLFDWEYSDPAAPAGYDAFHFLLQTGSLLERRTPAALFDAFRSNQALGAGIGAPPGLLPPLLLLFLLDRLVDSALGRKGDFPAVQRLCLLVQLCLADDGEGPA